MKNAIQLGDTVSGTYHGVPFTGIVWACDGSGYAHIRFPEPSDAPVVYGISRHEGICLDPRGEDRPTLRFVSRPELAPEVKAAPAACLGGTYIARA